MKDATLAAIAEELTRLRANLAGTPRAAVLLLVGEKCYFTVKAPDEEDAKAYVATGLLTAFQRGGLVTQAEIDEA